MPSHEAMLTDAGIRKYVAAATRRRIKDKGAQSLYLIIEPSGHKAFEMRFRRPSGKIGKMRLGHYTTHEIKDDPVIGQSLTLAAARTLAAQIQHDRARKVDVIANHKARKIREQQPSAGSFASVTHSYMLQHAIAETRNWYETGRQLGADYKDDGTYQLRKGGLLARWNERPFASIDLADIEAVIDEARHQGVPGITAQNKKASEARARSLHTALSSLFRWAKKKKLVAVNPCIGLERPDPAKVRDRVLDNDELIAFWKACDKINPAFATVYRLLALTGQRRDEIAGMKWSELHDDGTWHLPKERTKNKRPHIVPLSTQALQLIAAVKRNNNPADLLFTNTGTTPISGWGRSKKSLDAAMLVVRKGKVTPPWRIHDLRRTAITGMNELGVPPHIVEKVVNHVSGHLAGVAGTYNKSENLPERKAALQRWAAHVHGLVSGSGDSKIVDMRSRKGAGT
jgi:integrase